MQQDATERVKFLEQLYRAGSVLVEQLRRQYGFAHPGLSRAADSKASQRSTVVRGDVMPIRIGARTSIQDNTVIHVTTDMHPTVIAEEVTIGHAAIVHGCTVKRGALIGMGARILDGAVVGESALIGAGALVSEGMHIPPRTLAIGVPARVKRDLTDEEVQRLEFSWRHYVEYKDKYPRG